MARKPTKKRPGKKVARRKSTEVTNWRDEMSKHATAESEATPAGAGNTISLQRNGQFRFQGNDMGEELDVVMVGHVFINKYFDTPYDPDNPTPPACFAIKVKPNDMAPHDTSPDKQSEVCEGCWANEFKSHANGKGKACGNRKRIALIHADSIGEDSAIVFIEAPPTSLAEFNGYVKKVTGAKDMPTWAVVTKLSFDEHADSQKLKLELVEDVPEELLGVCHKLHKEGMKQLMEAPDVTGYKKPTGAKKAKSKKKTGKRQTKKKAASRGRSGGANKKRSRFSG